MLNEFKLALKSFYELPTLNRKGLLYLNISVFIMMFIYPITRSTTTALFLDAYGGSKSPISWLLSVIALGVAILIYNSLHKKSSVGKLYAYTSLVSVFIFAIGPLFLSDPNFKWMTYFLFVWKEVYIILLLHMALGLFNATQKLEFAKIYYGILGAITSVAGITGGQLVAYLSKHYSTESILIGSSLGILIGIFFFFPTHLLESGQENKEKSAPRPLRAVTSVKSYVFLIVMVVALTQFIISLVNLKFDILFSEIVPDKNEKTSKLGAIYSYINMATLLIQIFIQPLLFKKVSPRWIHYVMPPLYLAVCIFGLFLNGGLLFAVSASFIFFKAFDYSIFNTAKELLYFPLTLEQRYGAKYLADMLSYRTAKGLISFLLIFVQTAFFINTSLVVFCLLWLLCLIYLFRLERQLVAKEHL